MILLTGAGGMLGRYVRKAFADENVKTLGLDQANDIVCDLRINEPVLGEILPETVIHCAGTEEETDAESLNYEGTRRLVTALEGRIPKNFVFISSYKVYGEDAGEDITEDTPLFADDEAGRTKARAEEWLREWALKNDVTLTIIRPARMFGNGVHGETSRLFNDAVGGGYIHVRGNDSKTSIVTALDVASGIRKIYDHGGVYNVADGFNPKFIEMMEAMTANAGGKKRMTHLPAAWAAWAWRLLRFFPVIDRHLNPAVVEKRLKTLTLDGTKFADRTGIKYFNTIEVIERIADDYPYEER